MKWWHEMPGCSDVEFLGEREQYGHTRHTTHPPIPIHVQKGETARSTHEEARIPKHLSSQDALGPAMEGRGVELVRLQKMVHADRSQESEAARAGHACAQVC